jgi:hypothetical protein
VAFVFAGKQEPQIQADERGFAGPALPDTDWKNVRHSRTYKTQLAKEMSGTAGPTKRRDVIRKES